MSSIAGSRNGTSTPTEVNDDKINYQLVVAIDMLRKASTPISTANLQARVGFVPGKEAVAFLNKLRGHNQVEFDKESKTWTYIQLFSHIKTVDDLLNELQRSQYVAHGFIVDQDVLDNHDLASIIGISIQGTYVRAIRSGKNLKCRNFSAESGFKCNLYDAMEKKCENCRCLLGLALYPKSSSVVENVNSLLQADIREGWLETSIGTPDEFLAKIRNKKLKNRSAISRKKKRTTRDNNLMTIRANKIVNLHIYTADEYREELLRCNEQG